MKTKEIFQAIYTQQDLYPHNACKREMDSLHSQCMKQDEHLQSSHRKVERSITQDDIFFPICMQILCIVYVQN